jgi:hypothetical protein
MELVDSPYLSDFTKKTLSQFDWKEGDPIPVILGDKLLQIKEKIPASNRTDVLIDIEKMPPEAISEVNALLAEAKKIGKKQADMEDLQKSTAKMNPQVREAVEKILGPQILDDREEMAAEETPAAPKAENAKPAPKPVETPEELPLDRVPDVAPVEPMVVLPFCPRCGWDMRQKFEVTITDRDKEDFVACLLGNTRFKKKYELLGGRLVLRLRALLSEENKMIYKQLVVDQAAERIKTEGEWYAQLIEYRLACSVESISDKNGKIISVVPELHEIATIYPNKELPEDTPLVEALKFVNTKVLAQEVTKRLVGTHLRQFQRLVEALEAMALEPSFWNGIE